MTAAEQRLKEVVDLVQEIASKNLNHYHAQMGYLKSRLSLRNTFKGVDVVQVVMAAYDLKLIDRRRSSPSEAFVYVPKFQRRMIRQVEDA